MTFITRSTNPLIQARFFEPFFGRFNFLEDETKSGVWAPPVDVAEEKDKILVRVEVPGMKESDLKVSFEDGLLTVSDDYAVSSGTQATFQINTPVRPVVSGNTAVAGGLKITVVQPANATLTVTDWTDVDSDFEGGYRLDVSGGNGQYVVQLGHPDVMLANGFD